MKQSRQYYKLIIFADSYFCLKRHLCRNAHFIICLYQNLGFNFLLQKNIQDRDRDRDRARDRDRYRDRDSTKLFHHCCYAE